MIPISKKRLSHYIRKLPQDRAQCWEYTSGGKEKQEGTSYTSTGMESLGRSSYSMREDGKYYFCDALSLSKQALGYIWDTRHSHSKMYHFHRILLSTTALSPSLLICKRMHVVVSLLVMFLFKSYTVP